MKRQRRISSALVIGMVLVVILAACRGAVGGGGANLDGTWRLVSGTNGGSAISVPSGRLVTLVLDGTKVSGSACNMYGGTIETNGSHVSFIAMVMTEMACEEPMMSLEAAYHAALQAVDSAARSGDSLVLSGGGARLEFRLVAPVADASLTGTTWTLTTLVDGDAASSVAPQPATLLLADGKLSGTTGCRSFAATYTIDIQTVTVAGLVTDKRACTTELVRQDELVLGVIAGPFSVTVTGSSLTVRGPDGKGLVYATGAGPSAGPPAPDATPPAATPSPTVANPDPVEPSLPAASADDLVPPTATIDGVDGRPVSWCWMNGCADGAIDLAPNPALASAPQRLRFSIQATEIQVAVMAGARSEQVAVAVAADGGIGPLPAGDWTILTVMARFAGGDAAYAWSLRP